MAGTLCIIDDDHNAVAALKEFLVGEGFRVETAFDGTSGIELVRQCTPDVILLDLVLPDASGFKIAQTIQDLPGLGSIPIIAISLKREDVDKHIAAKSGFIEYIEKPLDYQRLIFVLNDVLPR